MAALHIRDISDILMKRLKTEAVQAGKTLREHVIDRLENGKTEDRRVEAVRPAVEVRAAGGRKSLAAGVDPILKATGGSIRESEQAGTIADFRTLCANCEHLRKRHGGFKTSCQEDNCLCAGFE
jgi:hypothetical protein